MDIESIAHRVEQVLLQDGSYPATLFIEIQNRAKPIRRQPAVFPNTAGARQQALFEIGLHIGTQFRSQPLVDACLVSETWTSRIEQGNPIRHQPSTDPQRGEALVILHARAQSPTEQSFLLAEMVRDENRKLVALRPWASSLKEGKQVDLLTGLLLAFFAGVVAVSPNRSEYQRLVAHLQMQSEVMNRFMQGFPLN